MDSTVKIYDISMEIEESMIVYPSNPSPRITQYARIPEQVTNESLICMGSHTGTHVDAGLHVTENGYRSDAIPLDSLYGPCKVLDLTEAGVDIDRIDLEGKGIKDGDILILKTENSLKHYREFRKDFAHISRSGAEYLIEKKVRTVGIDYLSVKKFDADNDVHEMLIHGMTVFEGLYLKDVEPGEYIFAGLPLRISCDAAPARVVLIRE